MFFVSCSDDNDEGSGINGTYATSGEYDNYTGKTFREMIVITKSSFTTYSTQVILGCRGFSSAWSKRLVCGERLTTNPLIC